jgi:hypothetical protein
MSASRLPLNLRGDYILDTCQCIKVVAMILEEDIVNPIVYIGFQNFLKVLI